jgi:hypothetical protein
MIVHDIIMARDARLAPACVLDWDHVSALADQGIITCLRQSPGFVNASNLLQHR